MVSFYNIKIFHVVTLNYHVIIFAQKCDNCTLNHRKFIKYLDSLCCNMEIIMQ